MSRVIHERKQQIAKLIDLFFFFMLGKKLMHLFVDLHQDIFRIVPVKADLGGLVLNTGSPLQGRHGLRYAVDNTGAARLLTFKLLPVLFDSRRSSGLGLAKNMGMTVDQLLIFLPDDFGEREAFGLFGEVGVEDDM